MVFKFEDSSSNLRSHARLRSAPRLPWKRPAAHDQENKKLEEREILILTESVWQGVRSFVRPPACLLARLTN